MKATTIFLYGPDTYRSQQKLSALKQRYIDVSLGDTNLAVLDGAGIGFEDLTRQLQAMPFLANKRLVVIKDLLGKGRKEMIDCVTDYLEKIPETTVVVFYESSEPDKRMRLFKLLNAPKLAEAFPLLSHVALNEWVKRALVEMDLDLEAQARADLIATVGSDLWRMSNEINKLAAFAAQKQDGRGKITQAEVSELVVSELKSDVFRLIEAIAGQREREALLAMGALLKAGEAELYLLTMIVYQYRTLLLIKEALEEGEKNVGALTQLLKLNPFVVEKALPLARRQTLDILKRRYERLLDYDFAIKTGELEPRLALELLIAEFCGSERSGF